MRKRESFAPEEQMQVNEAEAFRSFFNHLYPSANEILVSKGNIADVKAVVQGVFSQAAHYTPPLPREGRGILQHLDDLRRRGIRTLPQRRSAFTDTHVRLLQGFFGLDGTKKDYSELAKEENIEREAVIRLIGQATKALRYAQFAQPLRQFARFPAGSNLTSV